MQENPNSLLWMLIFFLIFYIYIYTRLNALRQELLGHYMMLESLVTGRPVTPVPWTAQKSPLQHPYPRSVAPHHNNVQIVDTFKSDDIVPSPEETAIGLETLSSSLGHEESVAEWKSTQEPKLPGGIEPFDASSGDSQFFSIPSSWS